MSHHPATVPDVARRLRQLAKLPVGELKRVTPKRLEGLKEMGIETVLDLITHYPRRYLDRTAQVAIRELKVGEEALVLGIVKRAEARRTRNNRSMTEIDVFDGSGYLKATFFNQPWRAKQLPAGTEIAMFGKVDLFNGTRKMTNPVVDLVGNRTGKIVPLYPQSEKSGLTTWELGEWIEEALQRAGDLAEPLPGRWADEVDVVPRTWAMRQIHLPESMGAARLTGFTPAADPAASGAASGILRVSLLPSRVHRPEFPSESPAPEQM